MAEENTVNLLEKITDQTKNDLIIFTTYTFDPIFFDTYILQKLKEKNPNAAIIVLVDSNVISKLDEKKDFTDQSGNTYALIPISGNLFHPKIFMFGSKSKKQIFLGSHNLTNSGLAVNLELCFSSNDIVLFGNCIDYVNSILKKNLSSNHLLFKKIKPYVNSETKDQRFLTNENEPILDKCLRDVAKQLNSIDEVIIFSPFFSETKRLIEKIMTLNPTVIKLCIQKNNHDLDVSTVGSFDRLKLNEVCMDSRTLHSKFIVFKSPGKDLILIGSPNFTRPALLETNGGGGNFESAILWEQNSDDFINYLKIKPISPNEVKTSQREFYKSAGSQTKTDTAIIFAYLDTNGYLNIDYKSETKRSVTLEFYDEDQVTVSKPEDFLLKKGVHSIRISSMSTKINKICFTENDKRVSNLTPVCNLEKELRIRSVFNLEDKQGIQNLFQVSDVSFEGLAEGLADILYRFSATISDDSDEPTNSTDRENTSESGEIRPSGIRKTKSKSNEGGLDFLMKILKTAVKTQTGSTSGQKHGAKTNPKNLEKNESIKKFMKYLKDRFKNIIITRPKIPNIYWIFLELELLSLRLIESKNNERDPLPATIINYLNEIIKEDENFSKRDIDKIKIWAILLTLTKLYYKNLNVPYEFDNAEILCAFKPLFDRYPRTETYFFKGDMFGKLEKLSKFKNKIDSQAEFLVDDERVNKEISFFENKLGLD